ncbi:hypothetical protein NHQ30_008892 [Ciborinia camelliae]|nr:hypothetical protein NHQ30_008892 [Ciborinia camelliae]
MILCISNLPFREPKNTHTILEDEGQTSALKTEPTSVTAISFNYPKPCDDLTTTSSSELQKDIHDHLSPYTSTKIPPTGAVPATTFYRFPMLPIELRLKIWRNCMQQQNLDIVKLFWPPQVEISGDSIATPCKSSRWTRPDEQLPIAFVNRESRGEILRHYYTLYKPHYRDYVRSFIYTIFWDDESLKNGGTDVLLPYVIYFNPKVDSISIPFASFWTHGSLRRYLSSFFPHSNPEIVKCVKEVLEVEMFMFKLKDKCDDRLPRLIRRNFLTLVQIFPNLRRITLVSGSNEADEFEEAKSLYDKSEKAPLRPGNPDPEILWKKNTD